MKTDVLEQAMNNPKVDPAEITLKAVRSRLALYAMCCGFFLVLLDTMALNVAIAEHGRMALADQSAGFKLLGLAFGSLNSFWQVGGAPGVGLFGALVEAAQIRGMYSALIRSLAVFHLLFDCRFPCSKHF